MGYELDQLSQSLRKDMSYVRNLRKLAKKFEQEVEEEFQETHKQPLRRQSPPRSPNVSQMRSHASMAAMKEGKRTSHASPFPSTESGGGKTG